MTTAVRRYLVIVLALGAFALVLPAQAQPGEPGRHIVVFQDWFPAEAAQGALVRAFGGDVIRPLPIINGAAASLPPGIARQLARRGEVLRVDVDATVRALGKPATPPGQDKKKPPEQPPQEMPWGVDRIDAEWAWPESRGAGATVAVIDTGIDADHPDLADNIGGGINFVSKSWRKPASPGKWDDDEGHGTHVAGIIVALDNTVGVVGVAPEASLYAAKVLDKTGSGYVSDIVAALEWSVANGMDVANMSLGTDVDVESFHDACDIAASAGMLLVAAAGNDKTDVDYPAAYESVIAVAATDAADALYYWSSPGPEVAIAAPGVSIKSTYKGGGYGVLTGTSMAAPHVAGTLALLIAAGASLDPCVGADGLPPPGVNIYTGCGLVDAGESVSGIADYGDDLP